MSDNGKYKLHPKLIELELDSGIRIYVTPLSRYHISALADAANERFPLPDKKAFEEPLSEEIAVPGMMTDAKDNPEYTALVAEINKKQLVFKQGAMADMCVQFPDFPDRQSVIDYFADDLDKQRKYYDLPADEWEATWRYGVIRTSDDDTLVITAMMNQLPVTEGELVNELKIFRPVLSRTQNRGLPNK